MKKIEKSQGELYRCQCPGINIYYFLMLPWDAVNRRDDALNSSVLLPTTVFKFRINLKTKRLFFIKYIISSLMAAFHSDYFFVIFSFFFIQAWNFLSHLPVIDVGLSVKGWWDDSAEGHNELSITALTSDKRNDNRWIKLHADQEYVLQVSLQRVHTGFYKV